ncbi:MAG: glycosyltransferase [Allosphingosinicella sp.]
MRIAFLLPHLRPGGAERVVVNYLRALDRARFEPVLLLGRREGAFLDLVPPDVEVVDLGGARARRLPGRLAAELSAKCIDIAYSATDAMNLALLASRWWGARRTRRIVSVHTNPAEHLAEAKRKALRLWAMRRLYPCADLVAAPTEAIARELERLIGRRLPALVLPNPVVEPGTAPRDAPGGRPRIVAAGRLVEAKGHDLLIDAAAGLGGVEFDLVIHGEGPLRPALERRIAERGLEGRVTLAGHAADLPARLRGADLCVLPSRREGFGNVIVEAMAAGVPVLAAACSGPAGLIEDGRNGFLVPPGDAAALGAAMAALLADPARRASVVEAGRRTARRYEIPAATRLFERAVEALAGKEPRANHPEAGQAAR